MRLGLLLALTGTAAVGQSLSVAPGPLTFRMVATGPMSAPQKLTISTTSAAPLNWTAKAGAEAPWIWLGSPTGATGAASADKPATLPVMLVDWRAEGQGPGTYEGSIAITPSGGAAVSVKVTWVVVPRLPGPTFSYPAGPKDCTTPQGYPDPALCTPPDETPPGHFTPPKPGGTFTDANFGGQVRVMTEPRIYHTYSDNNPLSANNKYLMVYLANGSFDVVDAATGKTAYSHVNANQNFVWDSYSDTVYYDTDGAAFIRHDLATHKDKKLVDYAKDGHHFSSITRGGTTATSKDNWISFVAPNEHYVCTLDLNTVKTYCADYSKAEGVPFGVVDYVLDAKGVDKATGKRYVVVVTNAASTPAVYSVNTAAGRLDLEYRGPEETDSKGNHDGVCDPGEKCMLPTHSDTFEDAGGTQYLVYDSFTEMPCEVSLATYQLNKGAKILEPVELGGGKHRVMSLWRCPFPNSNGGTDDHVGCAKNAPYCVISTVAPKRNPADPPLRFPHATEIFVMRGIGEEIRRLAESRSVRFLQEGDESYWAEPRAAISNDGSLVVFDSNYGQPVGVRVNMVPTGFGKPAH